MQVIGHIALGTQADFLVDLGLQVLDNVIMTRWKVLPRDQCQGKHNFF